LFSGFKNAFLFFTGEQQDKRWRFFGFVLFKSKVDPNNKKTKAIIVEYHFETFLIDPICTR